MIQCDNVCVAIWARHCFIFSFLTRPKKGRFDVASHNSSQMSKNTSSTQASALMLLLFTARQGKWFHSKRDCHSTSWDNHFVFNYHGLEVFINNSEHGGASLLHSPMRCTVAWCGGVTDFSILCLSTVGDRCDGTQLGGYIAGSIATRNGTICSIKSLPNHHFCKSSHWSNRSIQTWWSDRKTLFLYT